MSAFFTCANGIVLPDLLAMAKFSVTLPLLVALTMSSPTAAVPQPLALKPSSNWQVNYAKQQCRPGRQFGEGDQAVLLFMDRYGPGRAFQLTIAGKQIKTLADKGDAAIQFGPIEEE